MTAQELVDLLIASLRVGAFIFALPFFTSQYIPNVSKMVISVAIAFPFAHTLQVNMSDSLFDLLIDMGTQMLIGFTLAFVVDTILSAVSMAGGMMDNDMGYSIAQLLNPGEATSSSGIISNLLMVVFMVLFIQMNGMDELISGISYSFQFAGVSFFPSQANFLSFITGVVLYMLTAAVQISLPFILCMFMINFILLIVGKSSPKINIFNEMFMIKISIGIILLWVMLPIFANIFTQMDSVVMDQLSQTIRGLSQK